LAGRPGFEQHAPALGALFDEWCAIAEERRAIGDERPLPGLDRLVA